MTRKDYVATAEILKSFSNEIDPDTFRDLVRDFVEMFATDNPRFDEQKFAKACQK